MNKLVITLLVLATPFMGQGNPVKNSFLTTSFRHNNIAGNLDEVEGNQYWFDADYTYYYQKPFVDKEGKIDLSLRYNDANYLMFSLKEAQMTHLGSDWELSYGRLILDWVEIDKVWGLGKVNNRVNFDFFRPGQEGLVGVRFKKSLSSFFLVEVFASAIYVPELNPPLNIDDENQTITSKSPWAQVPDTVTQQSGSTVNLFYDVNTPELSDILFNESYGLNLMFSPLDELHFSAFYMRKPENNLSNTASFTLENSSRAIIDVTPQLFYHTLYGGQVSYEPNKTWEFYVSYYTSIPGQKPLDDQFILFNQIGIGIEVEKFKEQYLGAGIHYTSDWLNSHVGFLSRTSDFEKTTALTKIPRWTEVINIAADVILHEKVSVNFDIKYDTLVQDRLYTFVVNFRPYRNLQLNVGADIIGGPNIGEGYWVTFRDNDSFFAEVKYSF
jgi:hypothetical protein